MEENMEMLGPVHLVMVELENEKQRGQVARAIRAASTQGTIRVLDALAIRKEPGGAVISIGSSDLSDEQREMYGAVVGGLLGLGSGGLVGAKNGAEEGATALASRNFGLTMADIRAIAQDMPEGKTVLTVLFEHRWAIPVKEAIQSAGGKLIVQTMVSPTSLVQLGADMSGAGASTPFAKAAQFGMNV